MSNSGDTAAIVTQVVDRIASLELRVVDSAITGDAASLAAWWLGGSVHHRTLMAPDDAGLAAGMAAADRAVDEGVTLLVPRVRHRDPIVSMTAIGLLCGREPQTLMPRELSDSAWMERCAALRDSIASTTVGGDYLALANGQIAFVVGVLITAAARRTRCLLDGTDEFAAATIASRLAFRAPSWWRAASTSSDPSRLAAADRIGLDYALDWKTSGDDDFAIRSAIAVLPLL